MHEVIVLKMQHQFMKNNNYIIVDHRNRKSVIVDPAWEIEKIDRALAKADVELSGILLTHSHPDHIDLAEPLSRKYDCPIWISNEELEESRISSDLFTGIDETPWFIGDLYIQPIWTPGHTKGCICYLIGKSLFSGDVLFIEGCGLCQNREAAHEMFQSLNRLKKILPSNTRVFPGHTYVSPPGVPFSTVMKQNIYLQFKDKDSFSTFRMRSGQNRAKMFDFK